MKYPKSNIAKLFVVQRHKPLHLSEDKRQLCFHVNSGAKLPAKGQVTHNNVYPGVRQRYHCIHRADTQRSEVTKHTIERIVFTRT